MDSIFNKICVLVTAAFALTLVPGFRRSGRSLLSMRDRGSAPLVFMVLGLVEQAAVGRSSWFYHRIVDVCAAGLLVGPGAGAVVAAFVTWIRIRSSIWENVSIVWPKSVSSIRLNGTGISGGRTRSTLATS